MWPQIYHFAIAFFILASFWSVHHRSFALLTELDEIMIKLTILILFVICLLPFSSGLAGDSTVDRSAILFFHCNMLILGSLFTFQWLYICHAGLIKNLDKKQKDAGFLKSLTVPILSFIAIIVAFYSPADSSYVYILLPVAKIGISSYLKRKSEDIDFSPVHPEENQKEHVISVSVPPGLHNSLIEKSREMEVSKEELIGKILSLWEKNGPILPPNEYSLCNLPAHQEKKDT